MKRHALTNQCEPVAAVNHPLNICFQITEYFQLPGQICRLDLALRCEGIVGPHTDDQRVGCDVLYDPILTINRHGKKRRIQNSLVHTAKNLQWITTPQLYGTFRKQIRVDIAEGLESFWIDEG